MGVDRKEFLRLLGLGATAPLLLGCDRSAAAGGGSAAGDGAAGVQDLPEVTWPPYGNTVVVDALAGPLPISIPQGSLPLTEAALEAVRTSGITAVNVTVNAIPTDGLGAYEATRAKMDGWIREAGARPELLSVARDVGDIQAAKDSSRLGLILGFQDATPFEDDLARLDEFYGDGVRIVQLTYNVENRVGFGCLAPEDRGLTELGREVVARLDELGVLIDLSHCGPRTSLDGVRASVNSVSFTHTGCNAVYQHPRNKDDETLRLLADRGGVVGIYLMPFLNPEGEPTTAHVLDHIDHALNVCGADHVGIGSDQGITPLDVSGGFQEQFDAVSAQRAALGIAAPREDTVPYVPELNHPRRMETIAGMMASRGHSDAVIEKVMGANFMRLFGEVWGDARSLDP
jgi:membrane dipeptidase